jgi:hypothetical protein
LIILFAALKMGETTHNPLGMVHKMLDKTPIAED